MIIEKKYIKKCIGAENDYAFYIFLAVAIFKTIVNMALPGVVARVGADEIGTIAGATLLLDKYDWSSVLSGTNYYGAGFSMLLTPIMAWINDSYCLHQMLLAANSICFSLIVVIAYKISYKYLCFSKGSACFTAIAATTFPNSFLNTNVIMNETVLILLFWLTVYVMLQLDENPRNSVKSACLAILLAYGFTIHTRIIYIYGFVFLFGLGEMVIRKKQIMNYRIFGAVFVCFFLFSLRFVHYVRERFWSVEGTDQLNTVGGTVTMLKNSWLSVSKASIKMAFDLVESNLWSMSHITGGLWVIIIVGMAYSVLVLKKRLNSCNQLMAFSLFLTYVVIKALTYFALGRDADIVNNHISGGHSKWLVYNRYGGMVVGPIVLFGLHMLSKLKDDKAKMHIVIVSVGCFLFNEIIFVNKYAHRFIGQSCINSGAYTEFHPFMGIFHREYFEWGDFYRIGIIALFALTAFCIFIFVDEKKQLICVLLASLNIYAYLYVTFITEREQSIYNYECAYDIKKYIHNNLQILPNQVAVIAGKNKYALQFMLKEYPLYSPYDWGERDEKCIYIGANNESPSLFEYQELYSNDLYGVWKKENEKIDQINEKKLLLENFQSRSQSHIFDEKANDIKLYVNDNDAIYGGYFNLGAGEYEVTWKYRALESANIEFRVTSDYGKNCMCKKSEQIIDSEEFSQTFNFSCESLTKKVEFPVEIHGNTNFELMEIQLKKIK